MDATQSGESPQAQVIDRGGFRDSLQLTAAAVIEATGLVLGQVLADLELDESDVAFRPHPYDEVDAALGVLRRMLLACLAVEFGQVGLEHGFPPLPADATTVVGCLDLAAGEIAGWTVEDLAGAEVDLAELRHTVGWARVAAGRGPR